MKKLYELVAEWVDLTEAEDEEMRAGALTRVGELQMDIHEKIVNTVKAIKNQEAERDVAKQEAARLSGRASSYAAEAKRLRRYLADMMEAGIVKKSKSALATISWSEGKHSVVVTDESIIPDDFVEVEIVRTVKKKEIHKHIKATGEVPDGTDWVLGESSVTIR